MVPASRTSFSEVTERLSLKSAQNLCVAFISFTDLSAPIEVSQSGGQGERDGQLVSFSLPTLAHPLGKLSVIPAFLGLPHLLGQLGSSPLPHRFPFPSISNGQRHQDLA